MNDKNKPDYADLPSDEKFMAILGIIGTRLRQHPNAICSYSGGSDSDILIDLIERARELFGMPEVHYRFFNTGLEMKVTKDHVKATAKKYGVEITEYKPETNIVLATRRYGQPFMSKAISQGIEIIQKHNIPLSIKDEYEAAEDKRKAYESIKQKYPRSTLGIDAILSCYKNGDPRPYNMYSIDTYPYLHEYMRVSPPVFKISARCCEYCKKQIAHKVDKLYDMVITGERAAEGGVRTATTVDDNETMCFYRMNDGKYRFRPLYYVSDTDKAWYKQHFNIRYSDAYEVYGLTRTGCCGCPISYKVVSDLERIKPYEPNIVKAAWAIFGDSYRYRQGYNEFKNRRRAEDKDKAENIGQISFFEVDDET